MADLDRFKMAQMTSYPTALRELRSGRKRGHWIWYVFPQLRVLGRSSTALAYGIDGPEEAEAFLDDPLLRGRLLEVTAVVAEKVRSIPLETLMGSHVDALKLVSSLTLFGHVARSRAATDPERARLVELAADVLWTARRQGFPPCPITLRVLGKPGGSRGEE